MSFFIAGVSRRVSHELIRNYVGADRTEEGAPSQESTRYVENAGFYITPPRYLLPGNESAKEQFEAQCQKNFLDYRAIIAAQILEYQRAHGTNPKGIDYKRILEAGSGTLIHSVETSFIWTTNPAAFAKLERERDNEAADLEFQRFARKWKRVAMQYWPNAFPQPWMHEGL
jgi:thymidylate synthase ThyX